MTDDTDTTDRLDRLESLVERQAETIEALHDEVAALRGDSADGSGRGVPVSRRTALKAGGLLALLGIGVGTASADPQGQIGTSSDPLTELYTEELNGGVTGDSALTDLTGTGLAIDAGALGLDAGGVGTTELTTPFADLATLVGSPVVAGGTIDLGGNAITGGTGNGVIINTDGGTRALELGIPRTDGVDTAGGNVVAGHPNNAVNNDAVGVVIGGGGANNGNENSVGRDYATVGGGVDNTASWIATVGGGVDNTVSAVAATVGGGHSNTASGRYATVPGGLLNVASGDYSFAAGREAEANHEGAVVFGDSSNNEVQSNGADQFRSQMPMYAPAFNSTSARAAKAEIEPVDPGAVLNRVEALEVSTWEFKHVAEGRHMGPMAGDFADAFGLGEDTDSIATVDADGVALAAIQGLSQKLDEKDERIDDVANDTDDLRAENDRLRERNAELEARLDRVEAHFGLDADCQRGAADD